MSVDCHPGQAVRSRLVVLAALTCGRPPKNVLFNPDRQIAGATTDADQLPAFHFTASERRLTQSALLLFRNRTSPRNPRTPVTPIDMKTRLILAAILLGGTIAFAVGGPPSASEDAPDTERAAAVEAMYLDYLSDFAEVPDVATADLVEWLNDPRTILVSMAANPANPFAKA